MASVIPASWRELALKAPRFAATVKERTIFSLGGGGYYENPASDLLAFFLNPDGEHGFGTLFLKVFLACIEVDHRGLRFEGVSVQREVRTEDGKRLDLLVQGLDWTLAIENKILHHQNNPVTAYENHAQLFRAKDGQRFFVVLSPGGKSEFSHPWKPLSYKKYLGALRQEFVRLLFEMPYSKWHVFAREFILHLENEIYHPTMDEEQFRFVETNLLPIEQLRTLQADYIRSLLDKFRDTLVERFPTYSLRVFDEGWALKCHDQRDQWSLALQTPAHPTGNEQRKFRLIFYLGRPTPEQLAQTDAALDDMKRKPEADWYWWLKPVGYDSSTEALAELGRISRLVETLWPRAEPVLP